MSRRSPSQTSSTDLSVPVPLQAVFDEVAALTDEFCKKKLDKGYQRPCREMAAELCRQGLPLKRGKRESWAGAICYAVNWVNFVDVATHDPYVSHEQLAAWFHVSLATVQNKGKSIRDALDLVGFDPRFWADGNIGDDPDVWLCELAGRAVDARRLPVGMQRSAYERGLIPFVTGRREITVGRPDSLDAASRRAEAAQPAENPDRVLQFKVTLYVGDDQDVWRRIHVADCTLHELHLHIQAAMGWDNYHLYRFVINRQEYLPGEAVDLYDAQQHDADATLASEVLSPRARRFRFLYEYDFGDSWRHEVTFEGYKPAAADARYPLCLQGERACPPEDCGGVWGFQEYLDDPTVWEEYEGLNEFDPSQFDLDVTTRTMRAWHKAETTGRLELD